MDVDIHHAPPLRGTVVVPPDKAICHRAVLVAAIAQGATDIRPWSAADDCERTLELVRALGVPITQASQGIRIEGQGVGGLRAPRQALFCGESGTTFRLAAGLLAGQPFTTCLAAAPSLNQRPMRRIVEPLTHMGARLDGVSSSHETNELYPPLTITGRRPLRAIRYPMPRPSAQVKSAILLAGLFADGVTTVVEPHETRDHTERMLRHFGICVQKEHAAISIEPNEPCTPGTLEVPGDFSSAAFFLVAAACVPGSTVTIHRVSLNPTRTTLLEVLRRMGAQVSVVRQAEGWEPHGTVALRAGPLRGLTIEAHEVPALIDELPILMVAAASAEGPTRFEGIGELRVKETDRIRSMVEGLHRLGARIRVTEPDLVEVEGGPLTGREVESVGDHRTAMSLSVAGLLASGVTRVSGVECVRKSFPDFFDCLRALTASTTVKTVDKG